MHDVRPRPILWTALAIAATVTCVIVAVLATLHWRGLPPGGARLQMPDGTALQAPGLSTAPQGELARDRSDKEKRLHSAGWIDQQAGIAHIPIEAAMDMLAQGNKR